MSEGIKIIDDLCKWIKDTVGDCPVIIGISGGKDSSIVAALCVKALGKDKVIGVLMPNGMQHDIDMSIKLVKYLDITYYVVNIKDTYDTLKDEIEAGMASLGNSNKVGSSLKFNEIAETNMPARLRMTTLYAFAAMLGGRVANTCNLSEDWVGYATKYGDAAGDFSPLSSLTVQEVKEIGRLLHLPKEFVDKIPEDGLSGKTDEDNLGFKYEELDILIRTGNGFNTFKENVEKRHDTNLHKLIPMPSFDPGLSTYKDVRKVHR